MTKKQLLDDIHDWLRNYDGNNQGRYFDYDNDTFEGSAYTLLVQAMKMLQSEPIDGQKIQKGRALLQKYLLPDALKPEYDGMTAYELAKKIIEA